MQTPEDPKPARTRRRRRSAPAVAQRVTNYRQLRHPFSAQTLFSDDEIGAIHDTALRVLEELGVKILLPEAREMFANNGARVDGEMVFIGRDIVESALKTAPGSFKICAPSSQRDLIYEDGAMIFTPGSGCPNVTDAKRGRRPGDLDSLIETIKLYQSFDVIHIQGPTAEPQDIPVNVRHYEMMRTQMQYSDKPVHVYSRGQGQVEQSFEMIQLALGLSSDEFLQDIWALSVINSNSPRLLDKPMARGIMDFARYGQMTVITPFCLAGAMAPITVSGALALQHAESMMGIALAQLTKPGAPVSYGGFSSNVDMKSGSPAFGTPEHLKMQIGGGQLARLIGLPWRSAVGTASKVADAQGATETLNSLWGAMMANATMIVHAAGWVEGGLSFGYEKFINDIESLQIAAEMCVKPDGSSQEIGFDALADVAPAGHFFETQHTMQRYQTAFYPTLIADTANFGSWQEAGALSAEQRAVNIWERTIGQYQQPETGLPVPDRLAAYIEKGTKAGGAAPLE